MDDFVTIITFTYPTELAILRGRLESEGIECNVQDEMTVQVHNFLSNAIGGIKLQVRQSEAEKAIEILKDSGYLREDVHDPPKWWTKLDGITGKIPLLKKARIEVRLLFLFLLFLTIVLTGIFIANHKSTYEQLTEHDWYVYNLRYRGLDYQPNSTGFQLNGAGYFNEKIEFDTYGQLTVPGFNSRPVQGEWTLTEDLLHIIQVDTFQHILNGKYEVEITGNVMVLTSDITTILCYRNP